MEIEFDPAKNQRNATKHGISLEMARSFELETAVIRLDLRKPLRGDAIRVIGLRKANRREMKRYAET